MMNYTRLNDDIWCEIISYLNLKSIYSLEFTDEYFKHVLERTRFWERKIKAEFSDQIFDPESYRQSRKVYWILFLQQHKCNICSLCFIEDCCNNIPDCRDCDWLKMLP